MTLIDLQTQLKSLGFYAGNIDGLQGKLTIDAIKAFQTSKGLEADGVVGPKTLAALGVILHQVEGIPSTVSPNCIDCIKSFEGIVDGDPRTVALDPYEDPVLIWTWGWGHALVDEHGQFIRSAIRGDQQAKVRAAAALSRLLNGAPNNRDTAKSILSVDVNHFVSQVGPLLSGKFPTNQGQFDGMVSFAFNVGASGLAHSQVLARHKSGAPFGTMDVAMLERASQSGQMAPGVVGAFVAWSTNAHHWSLGLFRRRVAEAQIYAGMGATLALAFIANIK